MSLQAQDPGAYDRSTSISLLSHPPTTLPTLARSVPLPSGYRLQVATAAAQTILPSFLRPFPSPVSPSPVLMNQPPPPPPPLPPPHTTHPGSSRRPEEHAPIDENEWVVLLSEIIRQARERPQSPIQLRSASSVLHDYILQNGINPSWEDIALPGGRSLRSYQFAYDQFSKSGPGAIYPINPHLKRALPIDQHTPLGRQLMPKPSIGPSATTRMVSGPVHPTPLSPLGGAHLSAEPRKKRGRPSKKEQEERRLRLSEPRMDASQIGVILPSPRAVGPVIQADPTREAHYNLAASAPLQPSPITSTPRAASHPPSSNNSSSGSKKKRGRPPKHPESVVPSTLFGPVAERLEAYGTPPQTATRENMRDPETASTSALPDPLQQPSQSEPEETKQSWRMILNE